MKIKPIKKISHNDSVITVIEGDYVGKKKKVPALGLYISVLNEFGKKLYNLSVRSIARTGRRVSARIEQKNVTDVLFWMNVIENKTNTVWSWIEEDRCFVLHESCDLYSRGNFRYVTSFCAQTWVPSDVFYLFI